MIAIAALLTNRGFNHAFNAKAPCFGRDRAVWFVRATRRNRSIQHVHLFLRQLAAAQRAHAVEEGLWVSKRRHWPDRKSVVSGKSVSVRVDFGGTRMSNKKKQQ